jgi:hypothetical protein
VWREPAGVTGLQEEFKGQHLALSANREEEPLHLLFGECFRCLLNGSGPLVLTQQVLVINAAEL